ncbi:uncharacterized protein LOC122376054 [Amphibalanus amphitrite]|uniref:uncharacterized protein LOC122376054 n=1 Tax=Amphibalanus amphitrite TaxID=1232801 RepID=UPI001C91374D|nr:uncharacterized protein LOC122376054 [Amphibalanus amphitrite]
MLCRYGAGWLLIWSALVAATLARVSWTPIYPASNNQIDLWTLRDSGCPCPFAPSQRTCACCSVDGGCPCGRAAPSRCAQCGLQQHCTNMCNITLDSQLLDSTSGKKYGQIKMVVASGPLYCWYRFRGEPATRIEVQVYRMMRSGKWTNSTG